MEGEIHGEREVIGGEGYVVGTMDYIAPEQTTDPSKVDARCDVYSLGCTIYFALTGRPPFPGGSTKEKILRHRNEEPAPIAQLNAAVPAGFVGLVQRMMAKDHGQRLPSAAAVRHELMGWADKGSGLPLDRPEDTGYEQAVARLEAEEPSAEQIVGDVLPADDEPPKDEAPLALPPDEPIPDAIPVGIPEPARPNRSAPRASCSPTRWNGVPASSPKPPASRRGCYTA